MGIGLEAVTRERLKQDSYREICPRRGDGTAPPFTLPATEPSSGFRLTEAPYRSIVEPANEAIRGMAAEMSLGRNKELARAAIGIWCTGEFNRAGEIFSPDYVMHQHHDPDGSGDLGVEAMKAFAVAFRRGFPDFRDTIDLQLAEDDLVATRFTSAGTHRGEFMDVAPTGRQLSWTGTVIDRVVDGRIVQSWGNWDMMGMLQQLGAIPARPAPSRKPKRAGHWPRAG
jgi:predicted ester cyclase